MIDLETGGCIGCGDLLEGCDYCEEYDECITCDDYHYLDGSNQCVPCSDEYGNGCLICD